MQDELIECVQCHTLKSLDSFHLRRRHRIRNGEPYIYEHRSVVCRTCEHSQRKSYGQTDAGKISRHKQHEKTWADPEKRAKINAYWKSEHGKEVRYRYNKTEKAIARGKRYRAEHIEETRANWARARILRAEAIEKTPRRLRLTERQWRIIVKRYNQRCAYCGIDLITTGDPHQSNYLTMDHIIPISQGGWDTKWNVTPSCNGCNERKGVQIWTPREPEREIRF